MLRKDELLERMEDGFSKCTECGQILKTTEERDNHFHATRILSKNPPIYLISLPPGCMPGTWEAAKAIATATADLLKENMNERFQFVPFTQIGNDMETYLAIGEFCDKSW